MMMMMMIHGRNRRSRIRSCSGRGRCGIGIPITSRLIRILVCIVKNSSWIDESSKKSVEPLYESHFKKKKKTCMIEKTRINELKEGTTLMNSSPCCQNDSV